MSGIDRKGVSAWLYNMGYERLANMIMDEKRFPDVNSEIIHCRDCKHRPSGDGVNHNITFPDGVCPCQCDDYWYSWIPNDDWYCGDAERGEK